MSFNMPTEQEQNYGQRKTFVVPPERYQPLPLEKKKMMVNSLIMPLYSPHNWRLFNPTSEIAQKYNMVGSGLQGMVAADPLETFYFRMQVHSVSNFQFPDGSQGFADVICPVALNDYLVHGLSRQPLFNSNVRCAHCEAKKHAWDAHNARWSELGIDKKNLTKEQYTAQISSDRILSSTRDAARSLELSDRFVIGVFDVDKFTGVRPLKEGETGVAHQIYLASKGVMDKLLALFSAGFYFFQPTQMGFPVIGLKKDTQKCTTSMMLTEYDVINASRYQQFDAAWMAYITNQSLMADPSSLFQLITYEEGLFYVEQSKSADSGGNNYTPAPEVGRPPVGMPPAGPPMGMPPQAPMVMPPAAPPVGMPPMGMPNLAGPSPVAGPPGGMPPAAPPMGMPMVPAGLPVVSPTAGYAPPPAMPPVGMPPAAVPPVMPPMGMPPQATMEAPPMGMPPQAPMAGPPMGMPPQAPMAGPPMGMPPQAPMAAPPMGMPPQAPMAAPPAGMPIPLQPAPLDRTPVSPVPTVPQVAAPPPAMPTPPAGDSTPRRTW